jgi:hypothetical protein
VTTIAYSEVDAMFFKPLGIRQPDRLAFLLVPGSGRLRNYKVISRPDFDDLRASVRSFDGLAASQTFSLSVVSPSTTELLQTETVNGSYFSTLGVPPALGRTILPEDDEGGAAVAMLAYDLWRMRFASDPDIISYPITVPFTATRTISQRGWTARRVSDVSAEATAALHRVGTVVAGLVWLVLVVACTNLANLVAGARADTAT